MHAKHFLEDGRSVSSSAPSIENFSALVVKPISLLFLLSAENPKINFEGCVDL